MRKQPQAKASSRVSKTPRTAVGLPSAADQRPAWRLARLDYDGRWGWGKISDPDLKAVVRFIQEMERVTWKEIRAMRTGGGKRRSAKHKFIPMESCIPDAQKRLRALHLEEYDGSWFRFRLMGEQRLWGVLMDACFLPVWWDPEHEVCP